MKFVFHNIAENEEESKIESTEESIDISSETLNSELFDLIKNKHMSIEELLIFATELDCSDLYVTEFKKPYISRFGRIFQLPCSIVSKNDWFNFYTAYVSNQINAVYVHEKTFDLSVKVRIPDTSANYGKYDTNFYRYRLNIGFSQDAHTASFRMIRPEKRTFDNINFDQQCIDALERAYSKKTGICIETGPTGSGKSTTLAACINTFTQPGKVLDNKVIITLEDPIENVFDSLPNVLITQKELAKDFVSFEAGIKSALREHPNMIIVGEMRDKEVICTTVEAARTGHLVSTTFHASDVAGTISRVMYHLKNDINLAYDLIMQLNIVISQKMMKRDDRYEIDTQYLLFNKEITEKLLEVLDKDSTRLSVEVKKLIQDPDLQARHLAKDWTYPEEDIEEDA